MKENITLGKIVKEERIRRGLTVKEMVAATNISREYIGNIENDYFPLKHIGPKTREKLNKFLSSEPNYLEKKLENVPTFIVQKDMKSRPFLLDFLRQGQKLYSKPSRLKFLKTLLNKSIIKFLEFKVVHDIKKNKRPLDDIWAEYTEKAERLKKKK